MSESADPDAVFDPSGPGIPGLLMVIAVMVVFGAFFAGIVWTIAHFLP